VLWHSAFKHREKYIYIYWKIKREETLIAIPPELAILIAMPQELRVAILIAILQELAITCRSNLQIASIHACRSTCNACTCR